MRNRLSPGFLLSLLTIAGGMTGGCATNPVSGTPDLVFMTEAQEIQLGDNYDGKVRGQYGVYADPELQAYIERVGQKLAGQSHRPNLKYHFTVLDSPEVNAFAVPGGHIYITRGILAYLNSEAELAAVLGHEIGHVTARHSVRQHAKGTAAGMVGAILGAATGVQVTQDLFNLLGGAILSGYGREHELESDRLGAQYLAKAGYDPQAVIKVIDVLKNQEEFEKQRAAAEKRAPRIYHGVFASHPSADQRLQEVVGEADKFKPLSAPIIARADYFKHVDKLVFAEDGKSGVRHGNNFYHRGMDLALRFPEGWLFESKANTLRAVGPDKQTFLQAEIEELDKKLPVEEFLKLRVKASSLEQAGAVEGLRGPSHTGLAPASPAFGKRQTRAAAVYTDKARLLFQGTTKSVAAFAAADPVFLNIFRSLHPLTNEEKRLAETRRVRVVPARPGDSFAQLAKKSPLPEFREETLRLINGKYPDGEPQPGELIKIIE